MVRPLKCWGLLCLGLLLCSCASTGVKEREKLRQLVQTSQWEEALALVEESKVFQDEDSRLLMLMEKALIFHVSGRYKKSIELMKQAQDLSRELFTVSLSNKAQTLIANDRFDVYYGAPYERSLLHFYQALNYFMLYQKNPKKRQYLFSARAELVSWDSILNQYQKKQKDFGLFRDDLLAKYFGALIHEAFETRDEDQIALQLYKDAYEVALKSYSAYPSFNELFKTFSSDFAKFSGMDHDQILKNYVRPTTLQEQLLLKIKKKIVELTLRLYPSDIGQVQKRFAISKTQLEEWKKAGQNQRSNVVVILHRGLIPPKVGDKQYIGLDYAEYDSEGAQAVAAVGAGVLSVFAAEKLGLTPPPQHWNPLGAQLGLEVSHSLVRGIGFSFELPVVKNSPVRSTMTLEVSPQGEGQEQLIQKEIPLVQPLGDLAEQAVARDSLARYARAGTRLLLKHISALAASYGTYQALKSESGEDGGDQFAITMASLQYVAASKAIERSERADTRYWSTLPGQVRLIDLRLPKGKHQIKLSESLPSGNSRTWDLGEVDVPKDHEGKIFLNTFVP